MKFSRILSFGSSVPMTLLIIITIWKTQCNYQIKKRRPYYSRDSLVYRNTANPIANFFLSHSALIYNLDRVKMRLQKKLKIGTPGEALIAEKGKDYTPFKAAVDVTDKIIQQIVAKTRGQSSILMFTADYYEPQFSILKELAQKNGIPFLEQHTHQLNAAKKGERTIFSEDGWHWNEYGHEVVAKGLLDELRQREIF